MFQWLLFRSARTSYRAFDSRPPVRPSTRPPATIFPEFIDELKQCRKASGTPQIAYFMKADDVSYPNLDEKANTNTNTETNKGETNDSYDVIYFWKGDDKRILNMICGRQGLENTKYKHKHKDNYIQRQVQEPLKLYFRTRKKFAYMCALDVLLKDFSCDPLVLCSGNLTLTCA